MDPRPLGAEQWSLIAILMPHLVLFLGMMINTVGSIMLAHAVIPSMIESGDAPPRVGAFRFVLYPIFLLSAVITGVAFGRAVVLSATLMQQAFPRFAI
jgi:hypothetical protein